MTNTRAAIILAALLAAGFAAGALLTAHRSQRVSTATTATAPVVTGTAPTAGTSSVPAAAGSARQRTMLQTVIDRFARAYATYLDGGPARGLAKYGTTRVTREATLEGHIPVDLRDGQLRIASTNGFARTCCSGQETIVLADRSERYPLTEELLYEQNRWQVTNLTPVDLGIDRHLPKPAAVHTAPVAAAAARAFALDYVRYHAREAAVPAALTAAARAAITHGTDSLAGIRLRSGAVRLVAIAYGPLSGSEFAATATVKDATTRQTFSFLMTHRKDVWVCGAFL